MSDPSSEKTGPNATVDLDGLRRFLDERKLGDTPNLASTPEVRRQVSEVMIDLLAGLQDVDWRVVGLDGFGRPDGYLERQLRRWVDQLERRLPYTRPLPVMARVKEWLQGHIPESSAPTIVHGDFKLDNVMWDTAAPKVIAVFDWEMSTIGDPLADLGWILSYWPDPADRCGTIGSIPAAPGWLSRREMIACYEVKTGRVMRDFPFYQAFAIFKLAIIMEGSYARYLRGQTDDPLFAGLTERVPALADSAWAVCGSAG